MKKTREFDFVRENIPVIIDYIKQSSKVNPRDKDALMASLPWRISLT